MAIYSHPHLKCHCNGLRECYGLGGRHLVLVDLDGHLPEGFPLTAIKEAMVLVTKNNIFEWEDCYFLQLLGTAMGTLEACMCVTFYFVIHEIDKLLPNYGGCLLIFKRLIDDMFGIWVCDNNATCNRFKNDTNDFESDKPSTSVVFLYLNIRIKHNTIKTSTYQKPINMYQYIPPSSAHPPGMMRGIIFSMVKNYNRQNSKQHDYNDMAIKLFHRYAARGWAPTSWMPTASSAPIKRSPRQPASPPPSPTKKDCFFHFQFHPNANDIPWKVIRAIYDNTCHKKFFWLLNKTIYDPQDSHENTASGRFWREYEYPLGLASLRVTPNRCINIDTNIALARIATFLRRESTKQKFDHYDPEALIAALEIVMRKNIFHFGNLYLTQICGTAMGIPCMKTSSPPTCYNFFIFIRYIDDVFGIWIQTQLGFDFSDLKKSMNKGFVEWEFTKLSKLVDFLDMTITINDESESKSIATTLFEKKIALYLFIMPISAHPPGITAGHITGKVLRIHRLCSEEKDVTERVCTFFCRLM
ncbi:hypothetical protein ACHAWF_010952 [Thalassiosira exigua]